MQKKIDEIHYESFQRMLQLQIMLKFLIMTCQYSDEINTKEIMLYAEILEQKINETINFIDKLSLI